MPAVLVVLVVLVGGLTSEPGAAAADEAPKVGRAAEVAAATTSFGGDGVQGVSPARLLDSRPGGVTIDGVAAAGGPLGPGAVLELEVEGRGGLPETGVGAVVLNVTATGATAPTHLTVFPTGDAAPKASNLNVGLGETVPNLVVVKVGRGGKVSLRNNSGSVHVLADVSGWFPEGSGFAGLTPARLLDTRPTGATIDGQSAGTGAVGPNATVTVPVAGRGGVPEDAGAVVVNVTAVGPTSATHVTAFPSGSAVPNASNLNLVPGQTRPNLVVLRLGDDGGVALRNKAGQTHLLADVLGWFPAGRGFGGVAPARVLDTRPGGTTIDGQASGAGAVGAKATVTVPVAGRGGVPAEAGAVVVNVTGVGPTDSTHVTVFPAGEPVPRASNLNLVAGQTAPNLVVVKLGAGGALSLRNNAGQTHLLVDVLGWFDDPADAAQTEIGLEEGTVLAGAGDVTSTAWSSPTAGTAVVARSGDVPPIGGHLAVSPSPGVPEGFLGEVVSVNVHPDGTTTLGVVAADLQDAFVDLEIDGPFTPGPAAGGAPGGRLGLDDCAGTVGAGTVSVGWDVGWGGGSFNYSLRHRTARLEAHLTPTIETSIAVSGAFSCEVDPPEWLLAIVGPVALDAEVKLSFEVSAAASGTVSSHFPLTIGFDYSNGVTTNLSSFDAEGGGAFTSTDGETSVSVSGGLTGSFAGKAFGVAGFEVSLGPSLTGSWQPPSCFELSADVGLELSAEIGRWGVDWNVSIAEVRSPKFVLVELGGDECDKGWRGTITRTWNIEMSSVYGTYEESGSHTIVIDDDMNNGSGGQLDRIGSTGTGTVSGSSLSVDVTSGEESCGELSVPWSETVRNETEVWTARDPMASAVVYGKPGSDVTVQVDFASTGTHTYDRTGCYPDHQVSSGVGADGFAVVIPGLAASNSLEVIDTTVSLDPSTYCSQAPGACTASDVYTIHLVRED